MNNFEETKKRVIRLNNKELEHAAIDHNIKTDSQLAKTLGVSPSLIWRAKLPVDHPQYSSPGPAFIAGVIAAFGEPFERFFFLEESDTSTYQNKGDV